MKSILAGAEAQVARRYHRDPTSEEALTGDVAGAAITRMVEELPAYRLWNWLTRPNLYGLENIPDERPLLFVGNHTMYGIYDMPLMVYELKKRKGIVLRGLAHPLHYASAFGDLLARYGAVKATPRNYFKLLEAGETVLLYPGGAREVAKRRGEENKLLWKEDTDFVRLAMRFGCTIVPFAALGVDDAFGIALDSKDIMASPLGEPIRQAVQAAGFPADAGLDIADAMPPIALGVGGLPFVPNAQRLYFYFGKPIRTDGFTKEELADKETCSQLYAGVRRAVEDGARRRRGLAARCWLAAALCPGESAGWCPRGRHPWRALLVVSRRSLPRRSSPRRHCVPEAEEGRGPDPGPPAEDGSERLRRVGREVEGCC